MTVFDCTLNRCTLLSYSYQQFTDQRADVNRRPKNKNALEMLQTSKLSFADLLSEFNVGLFYLPAVLYELVLGNDRFPKVCYQAISIQLVMLYT